MKNKRIIIVILLFIILIILLKKYHDIKKKENFFFLIGLAGGLGANAGKSINYYCHNCVIKNTTQSFFYTTFKKYFFDESYTIVDKTMLGSKIALINSFNSASGELVNFLFKPITTIVATAAAPNILGKDDLPPIKLINLWRKQLIDKKLMYYDENTKKYMLTVRGIFMQHAKNSKVYLYSDALEFKVLKADQKFNLYVGNKNKEFIGLFSGNKTKQYGTTTPVRPTLDEHFNEASTSVDPYASYHFNFPYCRLQDDKGLTYKSVAITAEYPDRYNKEIIKQIAFKIREKIFKSSPTDSKGYLLEQKFILCELHYQYCEETRVVVYIFLLDVDGALYAGAGDIYNVLDTISGFDLNFKKYKDFKVSSGQILMTIPLYNPKLYVTNNNTKTFFNDTWVYPMFNYSIKYNNIYDDFGVNILAPKATVKASMFYINIFKNSATFPKNYTPIVNIGIKYNINDNFIKPEKYATSQSQTELAKFYKTYNTTMTTNPTPSTDDKNINITLDINGALSRIGNTIIYLWSNALTINSNKTMVKKTGMVDTIFDYNSIGFQSLAWTYVFDETNAENTKYHTIYHGTPDERKWQHNINNTDVWVIGNVPDYHNLGIIRELLSKIKEEIKTDFESDTEKGRIVLCEFVTPLRTIINMFYLHTDGYWYCIQSAVNNAINEKQILPGYYNPYSNLNDPTNIFVASDYIGYQLTYNNGHLLTKVIKTGTNENNNNAVAFNFVGTGMNWWMCKFSK